MGPELANGQRPFVRHSETGNCERGMLAQSLANADRVLELEHLAGPFYEVTGETRLTASGPSQVASEAYREGWSRIFGGRRPVGQA